MEKPDTEYRKYGQYINGQFRKRSKKAEDLFIGRAIRLLTESLEQYAEEKHIQMDTLRFMVTRTEMEGQPDWEYVSVAYEVGSTDEFTEEDRKEAEEQKKKKEEERIAREREIGVAALEDSDRQKSYLEAMTESRIQ